MRGHDLRERLGFKRWFHLAVLVGGQVLTCSNEDLNTTDARGESLAVVWWSRQGTFGHPTHLASSGRTWVLRAHSGRLPPDMPDAFTHPPTGAVWNMALCYESRSVSPDYASSASSVSGRICPPSTMMPCPVMYPASGEARKTAAAAMSAGRPSRRRGMEEAMEAI